jgi:cell division septal protein FtsQ
MKRGPLDEQVRAVEQARRKLERERRRLRSGREPKRLDVSAATAPRRTSRRDVGAARRHFYWWAVFCGLTVWLLWISFQR